MGLAKYRGSVASIPTNKQLHLMTIIHLPGKCQQPLEINGECACEFLRWADRMGSTAKEVSENGAFVPSIHRK